MKENWNISIVGNKISLIPYCKHHVEKYHTWMTDPELLEATASEPLSIEEEYRMQIEWYENPKNCTFIIVAKAGGDETDRMVGDANLFMHDYDDPTNAEIEIMIAEPRYRGKGFGREALFLLMKYGISSSMSITRFFAKINESNLASLGLFKSLGYIEVNYVAAFQEFEMGYVVDEGENRGTIEQRAAHAVQVSYPQVADSCGECGNKLLFSIQVLARIRPLSDAENVRIANGLACTAPRSCSSGISQESQCVHAIQTNSDVRPVIAIDDGDGQQLEAQFHQVVQDNPALQGLVSQALRSAGNSCTFICFGQTNSGKTYSASRMMEEIANHLSSSTTALSLYELRGEKCFDLLCQEQLISDECSCSVRENTSGEVIVATSSVPVQSAEHCTSLIRDCLAKRMTRGTSANETSSRSHAFCIFHTKASRISVVDLAGSERWEDSNLHSAERLAETKCINYSLGCLKQCIAAVVSASKELKDPSLHANETHIPYRNSKLTLLLRADLEASRCGFGSLYFIAHFSPALSDIKHSKNTLRVASQMVEGQVGRLEHEKRADTGALRWTSQELAAWVDSLGYSNLANVFHISGKVMHGEWIGHVERRVVAAGGTLKDAHIIYDAFHELVAHQKASARKPGPAGSAVWSEAKKAFAARFDTVLTIHDRPKHAGVLETEER